MAATSLSHSCPIRIISVHLLDAAGRLLRVLFLDREGQITSLPHFVPQEEALILTSNQQIVLGSQAQVRVL
jgi:ACT domain-containing protein